jgi:NAD(P)-dependent dehydrogenase (short-subunit alcohol dehydrogenase family)
VAGILDGKTAVVTGASRGIGKEIALRLAGADALVCVHYGRGKEGAEETVREIEAKGGKAFALGADVAKVSEIRALFKALDAKLTERGTSGIDILVNNAGVGPAGTISTTDEATFDLLINTNLKGYFFCAQEAEKRMRAGGTIVNISSMVSLAAYPACIAYSASKAAINAFSRSLAVELGPRNINVNVVAPGATATDFAGGAVKTPQVAAMVSSMTALGRVGQTTDIGGVVLFLCGPDGKWVTGQTIAASGGMHL